MASSVKLSICELTTPFTSFEDDLRLYANGGATGIGIWEKKLRSGEDAALATMLRQTTLSASVCVPNVNSPLPTNPSHTGPTDFDERVEAMCTSLRRLAPFKPDVVVLLTGPKGRRPARDARRAAIDGLREAARVAQECGFEIGLEPLRADTGHNFTIIETLPDALELRDEIGANNVRIVYDIHNLWGTKDILSLTRRFATELNAVHVSDWRPGSFHGQFDRTFPGEGTVNLSKVFGALDDGGYEGWYDIEILADYGLEVDGDEALYRLSPEEIVARSTDGFWRAWDARSSAARAQTQPN